MQSSLSSNQEILAVASDVSSPAILLERGMRCIQQGYLVEGVIYFARAREGLSPDQSHLAAALDALIQSHARYMLGRCRSFEWRLEKVDARRFAYLD